MADHMTGERIELSELEQQVRAAVTDRYPDKNVALEIGIPADGRLRIAIWPTKTGLFYPNQWVYADADGVITSEPDDGMTSISAKPWWVHHTSNLREAMDRVIELVDGAVAAAQNLIDERQASLRADRPFRSLATDQIVSACRAWGSSNTQRRLLNACAWVQLGDWYYGYQNFLHSSLDAARHDTAAMRHAATLMRAVNTAGVRTVDQWRAQLSMPAGGAAVCEFSADPDEDERYHARGRARSAAPAALGYLHRSGTGPEDRRPPAMGLRDHR